MKKMMLKIALSMTFLLFCTAMMSYSIAGINASETNIQSEIKIKLKNDLGYDIHIWHHGGNLELNNTATSTFEAEEGEKVLYAKTSKKSDAKQLFVADNSMNGKLIKISTLLK